MPLTTFCFYSYDYWELRHKVTFDGPNKLIIVNEEETEIDVQIDLYSDWKEWALLRDNSKYEAAMRSVGGDPLPGGDFLGDTYFMINGWKILINHGVLFVGNLFSDDGLSPIVVGDGVDLATLRVSNLVDTISAGSTTGRVFV